MIVHNRMRFRCALRVALALQLVALAVSHLLALALAKLAQHLDVNAIFPEFLFHLFEIIPCLFVVLTEVYALKSF